MPFVLIDVTQDIEAEAQRIRAERDTQYGNIYVEVDSDLRWVGEIGEICFDWWARNHTNLPIQWITDHAAGRPDFLIGRVPIDVKTVKRRVGIRPGYTAQITARHAKEPVSHFFFASYEFPQRKLWLLGGIEKERFLERATYYQAGDQVHPNYIIRRGHEIYNIDIAELTSPEDWIRSLE